MKRASPGGEGQALAAPANVAERLAGAFRDTTNSYKFFWLRAVLRLLSRQRYAQESVTIHDLLLEMLAGAWYPVLLFRLQLGQRDQLAPALSAIQAELKLAAATQRAELESALRESPRAAREAKRFARYVPQRFLSPWFARELAEVRGDWKKDTLIRRLANASQQRPDPSPYRFAGSEIRFSKTWLTFLRAHGSLAMAFTDFQLTRYLQARNPGVPGIVEKLDAPTERDLGTARQFLSSFRDHLRRSGTPSLFRDIYSGLALPDGLPFSVDHFVPWSFVAHDQFWNLVPVSLATNSSKRDSIPDLDRYAGPLARFHWGALHFAVRGARVAVLRDYANLLRAEPREMANTGRPERLQSVLMEELQPQVLIARSLGFPDGWTYGRRQQTAQVVRKP